MSIRRSPRLRAALVLVVMALIALPGVALGHAELDAVTPADKATVAGTPPEIKMTFSEPLDAAKSSITLVDAGGNVVEGTSSVAAGSNVKTMTFVPNGDLGPGSYTVRWTSASAADGDIARGTTTFSVAPLSSPSPTEAPSASPSSGASGAPSASPSSAPSSAASVARSPSSAPTSPTASTSDAVIPIVAVVVVLAVLGLWLLRGRSRRAG